MAQVRYMSLADPVILRQFYTAGPQPMAYPATDRFVEAFGPEDHASWLHKRGIGGFNRTLELYVHSPFADGVCPSCGRNTAPSLGSETYSHYLDYLETELQLQSANLDERSIVHLHWGGDTGALLRHGAIGDLSRKLDRYFKQSPRTRRSIDVDPLVIDATSISHLYDAGVNQLCIDVRGCDAGETACVSSQEIVESARNLVLAARANGINLFRMDVTFGLPGQTVMSLNQTLKNILDLSPQRLSLRDHAHLSGAMKGRRKPVGTELTLDETPLQSFCIAVKRLSEAGYVHIGMNQFARPDDELAIAQRQGRLHRNLQGYCTYADCDVLGLGLASISAIGPTYSQNARSLADYYDLLDAKVPPVNRGIELTADDLARRTVMNALMCHFEVAFESLEIAHLLNFETYFASELEELESFADAGLVTLADGWLCVTDRGRYVVWSICQVFDRYLRQGRRSASSEKLL